MKKTIKYLLSKFTRIFDTVKKIPNGYNSMKLYHYIGSWSKCPCLPVWRSGHILHIAKYYQWYEPKKFVWIKTGEKMMKIGDKEFVTPCYNYGAHHKVPKATWKRKYRKILKKYHLSWLKPYYELPLWTAFGLYSFDVCWKEKYGTSRYEFPPQWSLIIFGFCIAFWLRPINPSQNIDDLWWEDKLDSLYNLTDN